MTPKQRELKRKIQGALDTLTAPGLTEAERRVASGRARIYLAALKKTCEKA